jgi:hypothetical protein
MPAPVGTARPISPGVGYIALRSGASIVPVVIGGNDLLYLGRRIAVRIGKPATWAELAVAGGDEVVPGTVPEPGSGEERRLARRVSEGLHASTAAAVLRAHQDVAPPPGERLRGTRLTHLFR